MVYFLRNNRNRTIIECEVINHKNDLSAAVDIKTYSEYLLGITHYDGLSQQSFVDDIASLADIRGWWWEQAEDSGDYASIDEFVAEKFQEIANKYNLVYTID